MSVAGRGLASFVPAALWLRSRSQRTCWIAGLSVALFALALAGDEALSQFGCARCGGAPVALPAAPAPHRREVASRPRRVALRLELRPERSKLGALGGSYVVCVRACDGSFFPVSYIGGNAGALQQVCQSLCPNAEVALYSLPFGGTIDEAVSATGEPYAHLPNADKFEQSYDASCSCRAPGQSWAEALAPTEAKYFRHSHDVVLTEEQAARMSRPIQDPKAKPPAPNPTQGGAAVAAETVEPAANLDINGVDTGLKAAAAAMSRATSGIKYEEGESGANFGLRQGQTVDETGPDGLTRRVRILPAAF